MGNPYVLYGFFNFRLKYEEAILLRTWVFEKINFIAGDFPAVFCSF